MEQQYKTGNMGLAIGAKFSMDQNVYPHTVGPLGGTPLCDGVPTSGATTLVTKGWTASAASRLKRGDIFTIANVYAVNPQSRQSTGQLRQFVVTADFIDVQVCFRNLRSLLKCEIALFTVKPKKIWHLSKQGKSS